MTRISSTLVALLFISQAAAAPLVSRQSNFTPPPKIIVQPRFNFRSRGILPDVDRAHAKFLRGGVDDMTDNAQDGQLPRRAAPVAATNDGVSYVASVKIGSKPFSLLVDTGSANTWTKGGGIFEESATSHKTGKPLKVSYGYGQVEGVEYTDDVELSSDLIITGQSIGVSSFTEGFDVLDGVLGVGPSSLTKNTVPGEDTVPTVMDNLLAQKKISTQVLGMSFEPAEIKTAKNGQLTFGGVDSTHFTGSIAYAPLTQSQPAAKYWGIDSTVSYGSTNLMPATSGIVDTSSTLLLIASDAFQQYQSQTGGVIDPTTGLLSITSEQYKNLKSVYFNIGGTQLELTPNAQIWPRKLNQDIGGSANAIYLIISDIGKESGQGLDFILGYTFLERFYSVFDTSNNRVGFATTADTMSTVN